MKKKTATKSPRKSQSSMKTRLILLTAVPSSCIWMSILGGATQQGKATPTLDERLVAPAVAFVAAPTNTRAGPPTNTKRAVAASPTADTATEMSAADALGTAGAIYGAILTAESRLVQPARVPDTLTPIPATWTPIPVMPMPVILPTTSSSGGSGGGSGGWDTTNYTVIPRPADAPAGTSGQCWDGTYTRAKQTRGACSSHKGIQFWWGP